MLDEDGVAASEEIEHNVIFTLHALEQMKEQGATKSEVELAIAEGEMLPAKKGRSTFRYNFRFDSSFGGKHYQVKQVVPIAVHEQAETVVITVYVFYF